MQYSNFNASGCIKASSCLNDSSCLNVSGCIYASRCLNTSSCLNASGCMNGSGCLNAGGSTDVFHTIALIISGRPRVPIVCAERIIVSEAQVQHLPMSGGNFAVRINQILQTLLLLDFLPEIIKVNKSSTNACLPHSAILDLTLHWFRSTSVYKAEPTLIGTIRVALLTRIGHRRFPTHAF